MSASIFSPDDKNFCQFMTPNLPKPSFGAQFHLGMTVIFFLPKKAPGPGPGPTWTRHGPNLDQAQAQPGPGTGQARAQPGPGTGLSLAPAQGPQNLFFLSRGWPTPSSEKNFPRIFFSGWGVVSESGFQGAPGWGYLDLPPSQNKKSQGFFFLGRGWPTPSPENKNPRECVF